MAAGVDESDVTDGAACHCTSAGCPSGVFGVNLATLVEHLTALRRGVISQATAAAITPLTIGTQNAVLAPCSSIRWPAIAAPGATPSAMPVENHVMPSVSRDAGTHSSIRDIVATMVGLIAKPATNRQTASTQRLSTNGSGTITTARHERAVPVAGQRRRLPLAPHR